MPRKETAGPFLARTHARARARTRIRYSVIRNRTPCALLQPPCIGWEAETRRRRGSQLAAPRCLLKRHGGSRLARRGHHLWLHRDCRARRPGVSRDAARGARASMFAFSDALLAPTAGAFSAARTWCSAAARLALLAVEAAVRVLGYRNCRRTHAEPDTTHALSPPSLLRARAGALRTADGAAVRRGTAI